MENSVSPGSGEDKQVDYFKGRFFKTLRDNAGTIRGLCLAAASFAISGLLACMLIKLVLNELSILVVGGSRFVLTELDAALGSLFGLSGGLFGPGVFEPIDRLLRMSVMMAPHGYAAVFVTVFLSCAVWFFAFSGGSALTARVFKTDFNYKRHIAELGAATLPLSVMTGIAAPMLFVCAPVSVAALFLAGVVWAVRSFSAMAVHFPGMKGPFYVFFTANYAVATALSLASLALIALFIR